MNRRAGEKNATRIEDGSTEGLRPEGDKRRLLPVIVPAGPVIASSVEGRSKIGGLKCEASRQAASEHKKDKVDVPNGRLKARGLIIERRG